MRLWQQKQPALDGAATCAADRVLVIGATNRPQELDDAARRRLSKKLSRR